MPQETQLIEYRCTGREKANDTVSLAEFEAPVNGDLKLIGTGQATAFIRFNKPQPEGVLYRFRLERIT